MLDIFFLNRVRFHIYSCIPRNNLDYETIRSDFIFYFLQTAQTHAPQASPYVQQVAQPAQMMQQVPQQGQPQAQMIQTAQVLFDSHSRYLSVVYVLSATIIHDA